jgi:hypothetical protein
MINRTMSNSVLVFFILLPLVTILVFSPAISYAQSAGNRVSNPNFSQTSGSGLAGWTDEFKNCQTVFKCTENSTTGWNDNTSLQLSTHTTNKNTWSAIAGKEINVRPNENYDITTHMKLNKFATQSHIVIQGFDKTSNKWNPITQCPSGINGPLQWQEFSCEITIPTTVSKIRPILNAGWSSQAGVQAITFFDAISIVKAVGESGLIAGFIPSAAPS